LTSGTIGGSGGLPNPVVSGTSTTGTSTFTSNGLNFTLVQTVVPTFSGVVRTGSLLTQRYTISNPTAATISFELVRYVDGWFVSTTSSLGGRTTSPQETLFEQEASANSALLGITGTGGTVTVASRYEVNTFSGLRDRIELGNPLANVVFGDLNADGLIEPPPYDVTLALRNTFTLAPGASTVYETLTFFGTGTPGTVFTPPSAGGTPGPAGPEGSYNGSNGSGSLTGPEGIFGFGARTRQRSVLLGPFAQSLDPEKTTGITNPGAGTNLTVINISHRLQTTTQQDPQPENVLLPSLVFLALILLGITAILKVALGPAAST
jgi:hypothetical protein